jgi:uncharacterized protein YijF (DUF1287 family)
MLLLVLAAISPRCGPPAAEPPSPPIRSEEPPGFVEQLTAAALERTRHHVQYDGSYRSIAYPGGDVPPDVGVCTDVVIRAYRELGIDLQRGVHEDMSAAFSAYPNRWGLSAPDPNIDHRRVPNLEVYFARNGFRLPVTDEAGDYLPGDLVTWDLDPLPHIGIVVSVRSEDGERYQIVHNIGRGPQLEDMLFDYRIVGHFRYYGSFRSARHPQATSNE